VPVSQYRDVVQDVVPGEVARGLPVDEGARDLVVGVRVVVDIQAARGDGGVEQGVADRLRSGGHLDEVAVSGLPEGGDLRGRGAFLVVSVGMVPPSAGTSRFVWIPISPSGAWRPIASVTPAPTSPPWAT